MGWEAIPSQENPFGKHLQGSEAYGKELPIPRQALPQAHKG